MPPGYWDTADARALIKYAISAGHKFYGFELGNEKCGPPPALFAQDYRNVAGLLAKHWPDITRRPLLIGNDCNTNPPPYMT